MQCSLERYIRELTQWHLTWSVLSRGRAAAYLALWVGPPLICLAMYYVFDRDWRVVPGGVGVLLLASWPIRRTMNKWTRDVFEKRGWPVAAGASHSDLIQELQLRQILPLLGPEGGRPTTKAVSIEIEFAQRLLELARAGKVALPNWIWNVVAGMAGAGGTLLLGFGHDRAEQVQIYLYGVVLVAMFIGVVIMFSGPSSRERHIVNYLALLHRAKRDLDLGIAGQGWDVLAPVAILTVPALGETGVVDSRAERPVGA